MIDLSQIAAVTLERLTFNPDVILLTFEDNNNKIVEMIIKDFDDESPLCPSKGV